jgi:hypothetical protein
MSDETQLVLVGVEKFNLRGILRRLDAEAEAVPSGSERTAIQLVARLVRAQAIEIACLNEYRAAWERYARVPVHVDPTGTNREPPHCPTCSCGMP